MLGVTRASRVIGSLVFLGSLWMMWASREQLLSIEFIFAVLLALFGLALTTQRHRLILNKQTGTWHEGGDVFFFISLRKQGSLYEVGPVRINNLTTRVGEETWRDVSSYPITIEARDRAGEAVELDLGKEWGLEEAHKLANHLSTFLDRPVEDRSGEAA